VDGRSSGPAEGWPSSMPLRAVLGQLFSGWPSRRRCAVARPWACRSSCRCPVLLSRQLPPWVSPVTPGTGLVLLAATGML